MKNIEIAPHDKANAHNCGLNYVAEVVGTLRLKPYTWFVTLFVLMVPAGAISAPSSGNSSCPGGTCATAAACVLDSDLVLSDSIELQSFTKLDCRGHRIVPSIAGSGTTVATYVASIPAIAIEITGDRGVKVRNCVIGADDARSILALS